MIQGSFAIHDLTRDLAVRTEETRAREASLAFQHKVGCWLTIAMFVLTFATMGFGLILLIPGVFYSAYLGVEHGKAQRELAKLTFAHGVVDAIADDVAPGTKLKMVLDTRQYDKAVKPYWTGRSQHGNKKARYADRWFQLRFVLLDGTWVRIARTADVKVKKSAIDREKRRLRIDLRPNPRAWRNQPTMDGFEPLLQLAIKDGFHDPPELIRVRTEEGDKGVRLRIDQWDAPILPREVMLVLETVYLHLAGQR